MSVEPSTIEARFAGAVGGFTLEVSFEAPMRGITGLFGPSGSGKTTVLRCIAGLQRLAGRLEVGGESWQDDAAGLFRMPHRRPIGYVFQEASLFSHLSVRRNLLFGARRAKEPDSATALAFDDVVALLGLARLLERAPTALSGGERQRVAVGRALLSRPRLLLLDEPLSALDQATKEEILPYFEALREELSMPMLYVSHDLAELERLADALVLIEDGRVAASGALSDLQANPDVPLLRMPEAAVTLEGRVAGYDDGYALTTLSVPGGSLIVPGRHGSRGQTRRLRIRASDVSFIRARPEATTILNCLPARIHSITGHEGGAQVTIVAALGEDGGGARIVSRITRKSRDALALEPGSKVFAQIKSVALVAAGRL